MFMDAARPGFPGEVIDEALPHTGPELQRMLNGLLQPDPAKRPSAKHVAVELSGATSAPCSPSLRFSPRALLARSGPCSPVPV